MSKINILICLIFLETGGIAEPLDKQAPPSPVTDIPLAVPPLSSGDSDRLSPFRSSWQNIQDQADILMSDKGFLNRLGPQKTCPSVSGKPGGKNVKSCRQDDPIRPPAPSSSPSSKSSSPLSKDQILVFVSFSLPEASLKSLAREAAKYNTILVMRGLCQGSFVQTAQKIQALGITVDIDPNLFEAHQVKIVPTFIQLTGGKAVSRLSGNVTLEFAASKFKEAP